MMKIMTITIYMQTTILETITTRLEIVMTMLKIMIEIIEMKIKMIIIMEISKTIEITKTTISKVLTVETVFESTYTTR